MTDGSEPPYEIGYAKPPKHSRFQKGQSGNPKGRKPKVKNLGTLLQIELDKVITVRDGEGEKQITKRQAFITSVTNDAIKGNPAAREFLYKMIKPTPPPEPFVPDDDDEALLADFLKRKHKRDRSDSDAGQGGSHDDKG